MPHLKHIERCRVAIETTGIANFAQELSGSIASFVDVRYNTAEATLPEMMVPDMARVQRPYQRRKHVVGPRAGGTINIQSDLVSSDEALNDAATPGPTADWGLGMMLQATLGGYQADAGSTEDGASTASVINVGVGHGARWTAGGAYVVDVGGNLEMREIASISTDAITPKLQHSAVPTGSAVVYNAHTFYLTDDPDTALQFLLESGDRDAVYWILGAQLQNLAVETPINGIPRATFNMQYATWLQDDDVGTPVGGSAIAEGDLTDGADPFASITSYVFFGPSGSPPVAATEVDPETLTYSISHTFEPQQSHRGVNGVLRWFIRPPTSDQPFGSVEMLIPYESGNLKTYQAARENQTEYYFFAQIGSVITKICGVSFPRLQIIDAQPAESNRLHAVRVTAMVLEDDDATDQTSALRRSPVRIHLA